MKDERHETIEQSVTDCNRLGNASKMREALEFAEDELWSHGLFDASKRIASALSAPPRNCDVGTADEQHARFYSFCDKIEECKKCPLWRGGGLTSKCSVYWGQLPYEEGGVK